MTTKGKNGVPHVAGNRHERRKKVALNRSKYMRDVRKAAELEQDLRKDAIAARVARKQTPRMRAPLSGTIQHKPNRTCCRGSWGRGVRYAFELVHVDRQHVHSHTRQYSLPEHPHPKG